MTAEEGVIYVAMDQVLAARILEAIDIEAGRTPSPKTTAVANVGRNIGTGVYALYPGEDEIWRPLRTEAERLLGHTSGAQR